MNSKKLFVGVGRSGTGYISKLMSLNSIKCGHELFFNTKVHGPIDTNYLADSSWLCKWS